MDLNGGEHDPFEQVERAIAQIGWLGQRQFMQLLAGARFDLTIPQFHTLLHLSHCDGECKMSDLARATHQSAASLTGVVDRLLEKRLVERGRPDIDRRQVVVSMTARGHELLAAIKHARREQTRAALARIEPGELNELLRLLEGVLAGIRTSVEAGEPSGNRD